MSDKFAEDCTPIISITRGDIKERVLELHESGYLDDVDMMLGRLDDIYDLISNNLGSILKYYSINDDILDIYNMYTRSE